MEVNSDQLSDFLFDAGLVSRGDLARAAMLAEEEGRSLADVLVQGGLVGDDDVRRTVARVLGIPFVVFENQPLNEKALTLLPEPLSRAHNVVALSAHGNKIEIACLDTRDIEPIQAFFGDARTVLPCLTTRASMKYGLVYYQKILRDLFGERIREEFRTLEHAQAMQDQRASAEAAVRVVDVLLQHALHANAREMHIEKSERAVRVRYRFGTSLYDAMQIPAYVEPALLTRLKSLSHIPLTVQFGSGRFQMSPEGSDRETVTVMVSTIPTKTSLSFIYEHQGRNGLSLPVLGVTPHNIQTIQTLVGRNAGLVLVCGTEGAGKTSMLYALLDEVTDPSKNIASVEETATYVFPAVTQMEVDESLGLTAVSCVRAQLRQRPDVLMIDVPLTEELALLAAQAANQGCLVLMGVDAVTAGEGITRLLSLEVPAELLATVCVGAIGVHTVPRLCPFRSARYKPARNEQTLLEEVVQIKATMAMLKTQRALDERMVWKDIELSQPTPCSQCEDGYGGTTGLQEVVPLSLMLKECVKNSASTYEIEQQIVQDGVLTLVEDALYKAIQGLLSANTALEIAAAYQARYS